MSDSEKASENDAGHALLPLRKEREQCLSFESLHEGTTWVTKAVTSCLVWLPVVLT